MGRHTSTMAAMACPAADMEEVVASRRSWTIIRMLALKMTMRRLVAGHQPAAQGQQDGARQ